MTESELTVVGKTRGPFEGGAGRTTIVPEPDSVVVATGVVVASEDGKTDFVAFVSPKTLELFDDGAWIMIMVPLPVSCIVSDV
jgi:hypothetical protein